MCVGPVKVYCQHLRSLSSVPDSEPCASRLSTARLLLPESHGDSPRGLSGTHPKVHTSLVVPLSRQWLLRSRLWVGLSG